MAKDRGQRYQTPDDAVIDLECLLAGQAPKLARQRIEASTLAALTEGETAPAARPSGPPQAWMLVGIFGGLLVLSVIANLYLLFR